MNMSKIYICIAILLTTFLISKLLDVVFKKILARQNKIHLKFLESILKVLLFTLSAYTIFIQFEATQKLTTSLLTSSGIVVAVVIFAAQQSLSDVLSGVMMSWSRPFEIGERVTIVGLNITGIVESMTVRHTVIRTFNNARIIIPNSVLNKQIVENNDSKSIAGNFLDICITYDSNIDEAIRIIEEQVKLHELVLKIEDKPISVSIRDLAESGIALRVQIWTKEVSENFKTCSDLRRSILQEFNANGISLAYNTVRVVS